MLSDAARDGLGRLSDKQREVLEHLILYKSDKEIARDLGISLKTVEQRMAAARSKLGTGDRNETARIYAALRATLPDDGGFPLYRAPPLAAPRPIADEAAGAAAASFTLHDAAFGLVAPWEVGSSPRILPEVFHGRSATAARLGAIAACAIALLMMAVLAIAIGEGLTDLLG
jgi:DNA-binding CsgD family transcriptional regulator